MSTVKVAPAEQLPFKDGWFERALMWLVVHLVDRPRAFGEAARVLAPDGRLADRHLPSGSTSSATG